MARPDLLPLFPDQGTGGSARMAEMVRAVVEAGHGLHRHPLNRYDEDAMGEAIDALQDVASGLEASAEEALERFEDLDEQAAALADHYHDQRAGDGEDWA